MESQQLAADLPAAAASVSNKPTSGPPPPPSPPILDRNGNHLPCKPAPAPTTVQAKPPIGKAAIGSESIESIESIDLDESIRSFAIGEPTDSPQPTQSGAAPSAPVEYGLARTVAGQPPLAYEIRRMRVQDVPQVLDLWKLNELYEGKHTIQTYMQIDPEGFCVAVDRATGKFSQAVSTNT